MTGPSYVFSCWSRRGWHQGGTNDGIQAKHGLTRLNNFLHDAQSFLPCQRHPCQVTSRRRLLGFCRFLCQLSQQCPPMIRGTPLASLLPSPDMLSMDIVPPAGACHALDDFHIDSSLKQWIQSPNKTLILVGKSGVDKSLSQVLDGCCNCRMTACKTTSADQEGLPWLCLQEVQPHD